MPSIWELSHHTNRPMLGRPASLHTERSDLHEQGGHWIEGPRRSEESFSCDSQGKLVERVQYDINDSMWSKTVYKYDSAGNIVEDFSLNGDGDLVNRAIYSYDPEGACKLTVYEADGSVHEQVISTYDSEGEMVHRINRYPDGSLKTRGTRDVSNEGVVTLKWVSYGSDGSVTDSRVRIDAPDGKEYQQCFYDADGALSSKWVSYCDQRGAEIERKTYNNKGALERRLTWNYDPSGNLTKTVEYSAQDEIEEERLFVYAYDVVGNWTKRTFLILVLGSEPPAYRPGPFIYRTISYWPEE